MKTLMRAVITGFGFSLGAFVFRKLQKRFGLDEDDTPAPDKIDPDAGSAVTNRPEQEPQPLN